MYLLTYILLSFSFIFFLNFFFKKKNFLLDKRNLPHKSFVSKKFVPLTGGFLILFSSVLYSTNYFFSFIIIIIFFFGIFSDLLVIINPLKKIIIQFFIITFFLYFSNIDIVSTKIIFLDALIKYKVFAIFFTCFCILVLMNGSNFMDGVNTLVCGYYILVILVIFYIILNNTTLTFSSYNIFYNLLLSLLVIFFFNIRSKIYLGDSGTFLISFLVGVHLINLYNENLNILSPISPIFIVLLLWYPAFENLFSIIRKVKHNINPAAADNQHLHHLLFVFLKKIVKSNSINVNSLTGVVINFYNLLIFISASNFYHHTKYLTYFILFNVVIYILTYIFLYKNNKN